ncbi:phosphatidylserine decarboxylase family protein [Actinobacillus delphinicola]|uniref:Phosphatidylserine decarboxylase n=1 Tax=Actinobacillus delphinicola TaxID=51161 RepID=A0A448TU95_9PAST|nr:phosphatidylserine decarboxylase family protein [Actinobacillus delphinicola]VEJ09567.1 phosphatidylserine decarboxylase [Actinobacillus delphinicola]
MAIVKNFRVGKWLPKDDQVLNNWLKNITKEAETANENRTLLPPVQLFKDLLDAKPHLKKLLEEAFAEVPNTPEYAIDAFGYPAIHNLDQMYKLINLIIQRPPAYYDNGLIGCPINALFNWAMGTKAGEEFFLNAEVNDAFRAILDYWGQYLMSPASACALNTSPTGWLCPSAIEEMNKSAYGTSFTELFQCKSDKVEEKFGFTSWDDFFTRLFNKDVRPIAAPDDSKVIANACESAPYEIATNVKKHAPYWVKGQPYSMADIFDDEELTDQFVGGTIYQAYLSALSYHRWHAPITGTVTKAYIVPGMYYQASYSEGLIAGKDKDPASPDWSEAYLAETSPRAIVVIKADDPDIGLVAVIPIGMGEVSTCQLEVKEGDHVTKGQEIGMFHFGGSTHILVFQPQVEVEFDLHGQKPNLEAVNIPVCSKIATVKKKTTSA